MTGQLSITIRADTDEQTELADAIEDFLAAHGVPMSVSIKLMIAIDEIVTNIVSYAYLPGAIDRFARTEVTIADAAVTVEIVDGGVPFDPLAAPIPDTSLGIDEREIGGLGIHLVRKQMDEIRYVRRGGFNHLTLVKMLG